MFDHLMTKDDNTQEEKNLLYALHWLRMAIQSKDNKDKLLDLWTEMEFLMAKKKIKNLFSNFEIERINNLIESQQDLKPKQKEVLSNKLKMLNDPPLMEKIERTLIDHRTSLTEEENVLLRMTRTKRNNLIHGREDVEVGDKELNKLRSIIELILLSKAKQFIEAPSDHHQ